MAGTSSEVVVTVRARTSAWQRLGEEIRDFRGGIRNIPVARPVDAERLRSHLKTYDFQRPVQLERVVEDVVGMLREGLVHVTHPRYFGLFNPSVRESSIFGDAITAAFNPQLAVWSHAPAAHEIEQHVLRALAAVLGLERVHANFTTGGAEANLTGVLAALAHLEPRWSREGVAGLERRPIIYLTEESHHSFLKIARMVGLGEESVHQVPIDGDLLMSPESLRNRIEDDEADGLRPLFIVATAGTTGTGQIDPLGELATIASEHGIWFHVDAAWGAAAAFSPELRPLLRGIELADSVTWDAHKWLSVPMGAGMFFCRHRDALRRAFAVSTSYMPSAEEAEDPYLTTCQWSRRAIGIKVFMALAELGIDGYRQLIEHQVRMGIELRRRLLNAGWLVVNRTRLPVVCFTHPLVRAGATTTAELAQRLQDRGRIWISEVGVGPDNALRACITSYQTQPEDLDELVSECNTVLHELSGDA